MDPKLPKPARLTISRATNGGDRIRIEIRTQDGGRVLVEMTPEQFGLAVTGPLTSPSETRSRISFVAVSMFPPRSEVDCVITGGKL